MSLSTGNKLAHYEIVELVGVGGMGEVYRAKDSKLGRDVAIKVLPDEFARDEDRLRRFEREARVLAALNHPNIAAIYGLEHSEDTHYLVLEFVEGETLAERIARGAMPVEEALEIASKVAEALEQAHDQGIVHRDLKPANIKLTPDDNVKVLDFGLAKAFVEDSPESDSSMSPTITRDATRVGVILGTAAYMSPEQAKGKPVDKRADVWAFGAVVYEMLTGKRAFVGEDISDTLAAVLRAQPDMDALPGEVSASLRTALARCLEKNPKSRLRDMGDVGLAIEGAFESGAAAESVLIGGGHGWPTLVGVAIASGLAVWALMSMRSPTRAEPTVRFIVSTLSGPDFSATGNSGDLALSPDGSRVIYRGVYAGSPEMLFERRIDELETRPIDGTEGAASPFFSPDGASFGFSQANAMRKITAGGGAPVTITGLSAGTRGASWTADDVIIFSDPRSNTLNRVSAIGGDPERLLGDGTGPAYYWPDVLPGGKALLFSVHAGGVEPQIAALELSSFEITPLMSPGTHPRYVRTGHIVYGGGDGTLRAVPFDVDRLAVIGNPVALLDGVMTKSEGSTGFAISDNGSLAYVTGAAQNLTRLVWVDRSGNEELVETVPMAFDLPRLSPDGRRVAVEIEDEGNMDLYVIDLDRGTVARLTRDLQEDTSPLWNKDGTEIVFGSLRDGGGIFKIAADGSGAVERLGEASDGIIRRPHAWSGEYDRIVFYQSGGPRVGDIYSLDVESSEITPLLTSPDLMEAHPSVSPDGRWLAYTGSYSGRLEVYVRPFPSVDDGRELVSDAGGNEPLWSHDGRELFYWDDETRSMMAVPVTLEPTFRPGIPVRLFQGDYLFPQAGRHYDVSSDGARFLMLKPGTGSDEDSTSQPQIVIVQNWLAELERRVPVTK